MRATTLSHFYDWLSTRVQDLDLERMKTVTLWHQRRFGWGDARTTPQLLEALKEFLRGLPEPKAGEP